ncbi:hypothetical protein [Sulfurimonas sp.]|uniref:hypothetical protein n=1 Tax=Sulfurimonas sp. TaxID=2022749 RepID=UPI002B49DDBD|nr:hypothetical protein [Sulfurimonas sp.]
MKNTREIVEIELTIKEIDRLNYILINNNYNFTKKIKILISLLKEDKAYNNIKIIENILNNIDRTSLAIIVASNTWQTIKVLRNILKIKEAKKKIVITNRLLEAIKDIDYIKLEKDIKTIINTNTIEANLVTKEVKLKEDRLNNQIYTSLNIKIDNKKKIERAKKIEIAKKLAITRSRERYKRLELENKVK